MTFKAFQRKDSFTRNPIPKISIRKQHLAFNSSFVRDANLSDYRKVTLFIDEDNFRLGFEFHRDDTGKNNSFSLFSDNKSTHNTRAISAVQLIKSYPFIKQISHLDNVTDKQFEVKQDNTNKRLWIAQLCPAFENKVSSVSELKSVLGIYRYRRQSDEVVYIGKGKILSRLNSPDRIDWDFDIIEYSVIANHQEQSKWESFWMNKFIEQNGKLPFYNKIKAPKVQH